MAFASLLRSARAWLTEPDAAKLGALVAKSREASPRVPKARRADWERLLAGLAKEEEAAERTRARVEGLVRACRLFQRDEAREKRQREAPREPPPLDALDAVDRLPGLGPTARIALAEHGIRTVTDLVWLAPAAWDDLREPMRLADAVAASRATFEATGGAVKPPRVAAAAVVKTASIVPMRGRRSVRVTLADPTEETCKLHAFWFFFAHGVLAVAKPESPVIVVGRFKAEPKKKGGRTLPPARTAHPEIFTDGPEARVVRARYARLGPREAVLRKAIAHALANGVSPDPVPSAIAAREEMPDAAELLAEVHAQRGAPPTDEAKRRFVERLAWAEAFTRVWERLGAEGEDAGGGAPRLARRVDLEAKLEAELGFAFTEGQRVAIADVARDLEERRPMRRLLLGDVGTGKTAVALAAAAQCIASGMQVAVLAPTSVLAEQYLDALRPLERAVGAKVAFVAAGLPAGLRRATEESVASGAADLVVGTHALLAEGLAIPRLGLVVVDEQQRLGVAQRLSLVKKGARPHLLTLSATPIPRTLALALRGELATSTLRERPANRPAVATELRGKSALGSVMASVEEACARGERVFWIVPRIEAAPVEDDEEAEADPLASAVERRELLASALAASKRNVALLHGGMRAADMRATMTAFRRGDADVLVGTTVVEVGVDVPEATLIVIEDADRFGLAQLHQLRGRVGRGSRPGRCILVHPEPLEGAAKARLQALVELSTGEEIARADLELRGAGDLGGTRQHGAPDELLFLASGAAYPWLSRIEEDVRAIAAVDRTLARPEHRVLGSLVARLGHAIAVREEAG